MQVTPFRYTVIVSRLPMKKTLGNSLFGLEENLHHIHVPPTHEDDEWPTFREYGSLESQSILHTRCILLAH